MWLSEANQADSPLIVSVGSQYYDAWQMTENLLEDDHTDFWSGLGRVNFIIYESHY